MNEQGAWIAETLEGLARCGASMREVNGFTPHGNSQFATESRALPDSQSSWADRPVALAVRAGMAHLMFAESHLRAVGAIFRAELSDDPPIRASARQILEAAAYALWLLDTTIDEKQRARRGLEEARYALVDRSRSIHQNFVDSGESGLGQWAGADHLDALTAARARPGLDKLEPRPKAAVALARLLPSVPDRTPGAMPMILQRVLSGGVHPDLLPLLETDLFSSDHLDTWTIPDLPPVMIFNITLAATAYHTSTSELIEGCGWDAGPWIAWTKRRLNRLLEVSDIPDVS